MAPAAQSNGAAPIRSHHHGPQPQPKQKQKQKQTQKQNGRPRAATQDEDHLRNALDAVLESEIDFTVSPVTSTDLSHGEGAPHAFQPLKPPAAAAAAARSTHTGKAQTNASDTGSGKATRTAHSEHSGGQPRDASTPTPSTDADLLHHLDSALNGFNGPPAGNPFTTNANHSQSSFRSMVEVLQPQPPGGAQPMSTLAEDGSSPNGNGSPAPVYFSLQGSASSLGRYDSDNASYATAPSTVKLGAFSDSVETLSQTFTPPSMRPSASASDSTVTVNQLSYSTEQLATHPSAETAATPWATAMSSKTSIDTFGKEKPKQAPRLSVITNLANAPPPQNEMSPGKAHWEQVKQHVLTAPTPLNERPTQQQPVTKAQPKGKLAFVTKAAGKAAGMAASRLGLRSAVESVMGLNHTPAESMSWDTLGVALNDQEREEASRQRRRFARDIRICLDACAYAESCRRLRRMAVKSGGGTVNGRATPGPTPNGTTRAHSTHHFRAAQSTHRTDIDDEVSAFAPFLMELHRHLPDARAKRVWSRTCPHHSAILAELGVTFIPDASSTDGERAQALEVFGTVVRNWATDSADEELARWLWLCRALVIDDRVLRGRGLPLLVDLLHANPALPKASYAPSTAFDFESITIALLALLHALESTPFPAADQIGMVTGLMSDLARGEVIHISVESLMDLLPGLEIEKANIGIEHEMLWLAVGRAINTELELGDWLLRDRGSVLERYLPPPISEKSPVAMQSLRALAAVEFFNSFSVVIKGHENDTLVPSIAYWGDLLYEQCQGVPYKRDTVTACYLSLLMDIEIKGHQQQEDDGPFSAAGQAFSDNHARLVHLLESCPKAVVDEAASRVIATTPLAVMQFALRKFLDSDLVKAGRAAVPHVLKRLKPTDAADPALVTFLNWLASRHPQLFYKPLFSCAAATHKASLAGPLQVVINLQRIVGPDRFWTHADQQMVMIVLVGNVAVQPAKGKGKAGSEDMPTVNVKLGRYAVLVELVLALQVRRLSTGSAMKEFLTQLETKLAAVLEAEEADGPHPQSYLSLLCQLFERLRLASSWVKRTIATRLLVKWFTGGKDVLLPTVSSAAEGTQIRILHSLYTTEFAEFGPDRLAILNKTVEKAMSSSLVTVQASMSKDDWLTLLPVLWARYGVMGQPTEQLTFLMMKCAEQLPEAVRSIVTRDLESPSSEKHLEALLKLATLYGYRYQVFTQQTVTDSKRGPLFRFNARILDFVMAEMGSSVWVTPREAQDAQLQKYGRSLPLELRQRLWDLGWNEDSQLTIHDYERVPVTLLPAESYAESTKLERSASGNSTEVPKRSKSLRAVKSRGGTVHRAVLPPIIGRLVNDQARMFINFDDSLVVVSSEELVRMFEREDPGHFARAFTENLQSEFDKALRRVNSVIQAPTPSYAYTALNAIAGYLKLNVKDDANFVHWPVLLGTLSRIVPHVSELSLRDVRKTKSEAALLPASIYDDDAGAFRIHQPWRTAYLDVQTGQLVLLESILRSNPRDVYLVKKMLFNLQVQASFRHFPFARAWLLLVVQMFRCLNANYNDRAELRHFVRNITQVVALHGASDIIMMGQAMVALSLCSARFRRAFGSIGFVDLMRQLYVLYVYGTPGIRDCIEYACRSFHRIHQDTFIYHTFLAICESPFDPGAAYELLSALGVPNGPAAGVASGIRGLNDQYELEALVQMISAGPEITLAEIRTSVAERQAQKAANLDLEPELFPQADIVRFLVTVIAFNAASPRAIKFLRLFTLLVPNMMRADDERTRDLLREGIDALGKFINTRCASADERILLRFEPGEGAGEADWTQAYSEYVALVDAYAAAGGVLPGTATRRLLAIIGSLLAAAPRGTPAVSSILGSLARASLKSKDPYAFMKHIAPLYRQHIGTVDFSAVLSALAAHIRAAGAGPGAAGTGGAGGAPELSAQMTALVAFEYVEPALRMLALASEASLAFVVPMRHAAIELLSAAVFLRGCDALAVLERVSMSPGLLAGVVLPFALALEPAPGGNGSGSEAAYAGIWLRLLRLVIHPVLGRRRARARSQPQLHTAALHVLALQVIKVIVIRAPDAISGVTGLWAHVSAAVGECIADGNGAFHNSLGRKPRVADWMLWSTFELLCLFRTPLNVALRQRVQTTLAAMHGDGDGSRPGSASSQGSDGWSPRSPRLRHASPARSLSGLARRPSARVPSLALSPALSPGHSRTSSQAGSPGASPALGSGPAPGFRKARLSRIQSMGSPAQLSPLAPPRSPGSPGHSPPGSPTRPSFAAISAARSASAGPGRPLFDAFATASPAAPPGIGLGLPSSSASHERRLHKRFTSDQPARGSDKGAIVHLLGPASQVASASGTGWALSRPAGAAGASGDGARARGNAALLMPLASAGLVAAVERAVATCAAVYGFAPGGADGRDGSGSGAGAGGVRPWAAADALAVVSEQTRVLVENEFGRVFRPAAPRAADDAADALGHIAAGLDADRDKEKELDAHDDDETADTAHAHAHAHHPSVTLSVGGEAHSVPSLLLAPGAQNAPASPRSPLSDRSGQTPFATPRTPGTPTAFDAADATGYSYFPPTPTLADHQYHELEPR